MPSSAREAFFALRAFNVEIASIKDASRLVGGRSRASRRSDTNGPSILSDNGFEEVGSGLGVGDASLASRLRMQWWREAIAEIYDSMHNDLSHQNHEKSQQPSPHDSLLQSLTSSRKHNPTLRSLSHAIRTHGLTHQFLRRMMEARDRDLEMMQYERWKDVAQYGEDTVSSVLYLSLECVGVSQFHQLYSCILSCSVI